MKIMNPLSEKELIDTNYRSYAMYTLQSRAIPSYIDGMKMVHRKIIYFANKEARNKKTKVADFGSISKHGYHHGETSAQSTAIGMASDWNNNVPLLEGFGDFGSRLSHTSAAPRYIYAKLSDAWDTYFDSHEVCPDHPDPEFPEPRYYLPKIPWVLVNGSEGIAVAFATKILPRSPKDIASYCLDVMNNKTGMEDTIVPTFPDFKGTVFQGDKGSKHWVVRGVYDLTRNIYRITELPVGWDREKYVEFLNKLVDKGTIKDFSDLCDETGFVFEVKTTREQKDRIEKDPYKTLKLETHLHENLTVLDENGEILVFETVSDLILSFIDLRIRKYEEYIKYKINETMNRVDYLKDKLWFVMEVLEGRLDLMSYTKKALENYLSSNCLSPKASSLVSIPAYSFTKDEVSRLNKILTEAEKELDYWKKVCSSDFYKKKLKGL